MLEHDFKYKDLISKMTLEEKISLLDGMDFWHTQPIERLGIPSVMLCDGPHGLRKKNPDTKKSSLGHSVPAVCFPTASVTACSWDTELMTRMGEALGDMCLKENVAVLLGPGVNMKRSPMCGRNFEYFSEDPYLAGKLAAAFINGVQSRGVGTSLKHFAANNQETRRMRCNSVVDERALREIYLTAFEIAVKEGRPWTVMSSYNRINGEHGAENAHLLNEILRGEWGFDGVVVSDWGAINDRVKGLRNGNDLEMPSSFGYNGRKISEAVKNSELDEKYIDISVDRILDMVFKAQKNAKKGYTVDFEAQHELAREIAGKSIVLLKNEGDILPLNKSARVAVIGEMAKNPRYQGAGSSLINPTRVDNAYDSLAAARVDISAYERGYSIKTNKINNSLINAAVNAARGAETALIFAGLTESFDSEGFDRTTMSLPENQNELISRVAGANPNTVVVLSGGSSVSMPWLSKVKAVVNSYLCGQAGGLAVADILTGRVNPSGKLAESFPVGEEDVPCRNNFPGGTESVEYRESVYIGYRYYDTFKKDVLFPFGHGLSYTRFEYSGLNIDEKGFSDTGRLRVSFNIKNTGGRAGAETAQLYVRDPESTVFRPEKELKGFTKIYLEPGEEKTAVIETDERAFAYYNTNVSDWQTEGGEFEILIGASSRDIRLSGKITLPSTEDLNAPDLRQAAPSYYTGDPAKVTDREFEAVLGGKIPPSQRDKNQPLSFENTIEDAKNTKWGGRIYNTIMGVMKLVNKGPNAALMSAVAVQTPIRCMIAMSCGVFDEKAAIGLIKTLNGQKGGKRQLIGRIPHIIRNVGNIFKYI